MSEAFYRTMRALGSPFKYRCLGLENVRTPGPAIYVSNHVDSTGPIQVMISVPLRFHPWVIAEMTDLRRAPPYLYREFVERELHLRGRLGMAVSTVLSAIAVALMRGLRCVPVDRNEGRFMPPLRRSLALLKEGRNLLVFPESNVGPVDPETRMRPFLCGFLMLCAMFREATGRDLPLYPMAVSVRQRAILIGRRIFFDPPSKRSREVRRFGQQLQERVRELWRSLQAGTEACLKKMAPPKSRLQ